MTTSLRDPSSTPAVLTLDTEAAADPDRVGGKAAALSRAARQGLHVPEGVVLPVEATRIAADDAPTVLAAAITDVVDGVEAPMIARSSSPVEDRAESSMAGRFESVADIHTGDDLAAAIVEVLRSRDRVADEEGMTDLDVAVLVQRQVPAAVSGVLFTIDPVTGNEERLVISIVEGAPEDLVSGRAEASRYLLDRGGTVLERVEGDDGADLDDEVRHQLVGLADELGQLFDEPQDVEWAAGADGMVWLLQTRPVTEVGGDAAVDRRRAPRDTGPVYGPGPISETFPEPLGPLEQDLWIPPLRRALRAAFEAIGAASESDLDRSEIVTVVDGWPAVDLDLFGSAPRETSWLRRFVAFGRKFRRLTAAWRVGSLRAELDQIAAEALDATDRRLREVPPIADLSDWQLLGLLDHASAALESVHGHEVLSGLLADDGGGQLTGPSVALRVLATARKEGHDDPEIIGRWPVVLALAPPRIGPPQLARTPGDLPPRPITHRDDDTAPVLREALRLRARWLQELQARAVAELAARLQDRGHVRALDDVRAMRLSELRAVVAGESDPVPALSDSRVATGPPLPRAFQLRDGDVVAVTGGDEGGSGAGGGRGRGPAHLGDDPQDGDVLVVRTLDPALAPVVGRLGGLVAATGSVLSHVAILAREAGVPTVVGVHGATQRFTEGDVLEVDGDTGAVDLAEEAG